MPVTTTALSAVFFGTACLLAAPVARAQERRASNIQIAHGWDHREPGISEDVPKSMFTFENLTVGGWGSSYLFVDFIRSWSAADTNAKEVYAEWYPSLSLRKISGKHLRVHRSRAVPGPANRLPGNDLPGHPFVVPSDEDGGPGDEL